MPAAGSNSFFRCAGLSVSTNSHVSLQQVSAVRCTIAFAYHDMGMNLGLAIFQSHIAD
jgi:hypothetical protein